MSLRLSSLVTNLFTYDPLIMGSVVTFGSLGVALNLTVGVEPLPTRLAMMAAGLAGGVVGFVILFGMGMCVLSSYTQLVPRDKTKDLHDICEPGKWVDARRFKQPDFGGSFVEAYISGKADMKDGVDLLEVLEGSSTVGSGYFRHRLTLWHLRSFLLDLIPGLYFRHTKGGDTAEIRDTYDRGDDHDFYGKFLGHAMIYTSGVFKTGTESLEEAQVNKLEMIAKKLQLKKGDRHLDIGCGWGALGAHSAQYYGTKCSLVTLSRDGKKHAEALFEERNIPKRDRPEVYLCDYRDTPGYEGTPGYGKVKYDKISNVEMSEHVGLIGYEDYMRNIASMLEDDGLYFLQVAGLRRCWQWQDLCWGLFMGNYIFPGADASTPLSWYTNQIEQAGLEVRSVENIGIHYSETLRAWYHNWMSNKDLIIAKHGEYWFRLWCVFLSWSTVASKHGSATCYQIVAHKNKSSFDRKKTFVGKEFATIGGLELNPKLPSPKAYFPGQVAKAE